MIFFLLEKIDVTIPLYIGSYMHNLENDERLESPIEKDFAYAMQKYLSDMVRCIPQVEVQTLCGEFRIDFVCTNQVDGRSVAFECDGKEFHDPSRDEWRDAMILGEEHVHRVYRIRGADIYYRLEDVLFSLSQLEPSMFSERGKTNLERLASDQVKSILKQRFTTSIRVAYFDEYANRNTSMWVEWRSNPVTDVEREFWETAYKFAFSRGGGLLDDVMESYRRDV